MGSEFVRVNAEFLTKKHPVVAPSNPGAPNNAPQHSDWWYMYHAVFDQWTADKQTCHDLNAYANDLGFVAASGAGATAVGVAAKKVAGVAALETIPLAVSSAWIKSWTGHHCQ